MSDKITGRILVVDDQANWRAALVHLLSQEGCAVITASCFEEAIKEISRQQFDLVVLDIRLTDTDIFNVQGIELLQMLKAQAPAPGVIILTGYPESIRTGILQMYRADALFHKVPPGSKFDSQDFKEKVRKLLQSRTVTELPAKLLQ